MHIWKMKTRRVVAQQQMRQRRLMATKKKMESQRRRALEMCVPPPLVRSMCCKNRLSVHGGSILKLTWHVLNFMSIDLSPGHSNILEDCASAPVHLQLRLAPAESPSSI